MEFFIPGVKEDVTEQIYRVYREQVSATAGHEVSGSRYFSIDFTQNGKRYYNVVGEKDRDTSKVVLCIFRSTRAFGAFYVYVQTRRGYHGGSAILADGGRSTFATTFDGYIPHPLNTPL
jgi:hypothetical protein